MLGGDSDSHVNSGFWLLNWKDWNESTPGTVVVAGLGRSGTSMLAAVLEAAGVCMGEQTATGTHEDQQLARLLRQRRSSELRRLIADRDSTYQLWGFKLPSRQIQDHSLFRQLRSPFLLVIFRDILAIAGRRQVSRGENLRNQLSQSLREYTHLLRFLNKVKHPCLLISYEKALLAPERLVDQLDTFLGLNLDPATRAACMARIEVSPEVYRREVREQVGWQGRLDEITMNRIHGWAFIEQAESPAQVEIRINGILRHTCHANKPRPDVQKNHGLRTAACGFDIELHEPALQLKPGDRVSAKVATFEMELRNSPLTLGKDSACIE